jgi:hypothetical protein
VAVDVHQELRLAHGVHQAPQRRALLQGNRGGTGGCRAKEASGRPCITVCVSVCVRVYMCACVRVYAVEIKCTHVCARACVYE